MSKVQALGFLIVTDAMSTNTDQTKPLVVSKNGCQQPNMTKYEFKNSGLERLGVFEKAEHRTSALIAILPS